MTPLAERANAAILSRSSDWLVDLRRSCIANGKGNSLLRKMDANRKRIPFDGQKMSYSQLVAVRWLLPPVRVHQTFIYRRLPYTNSRMKACQRIASSEANWSCLYNFRVHIAATAVMKNHSTKLEKHLNTTSNIARFIRFSLSFKISVLSLYWMDSLDLDMERD
jgi:hypothetical protein